MNDNLPDTLPVDALKAREPSVRELIAEAIKLTEVSDDLAAALDDMNALGRETVAAWTEAAVLATHVLHRNLDTVKDEHASWD